MNERPQTLRQLYADLWHHKRLLEEANDNAAECKPLFSKISDINAMISMLEQPPTPERTPEEVAEKAAQAEAIHDFEAERQELEMLEQAIAANEHLLPVGVLNAGTEELLEPHRPM